MRQSCLEQVHETLGLASTCALTWSWGAKGQSSLPKEQEWAGPGFPEPQFGEASIACLRSSQWAT